MDSVVMGNTWRRYIVLGIWLKVISLTAESYNCSIAEESFNT